MKAPGIARTVSLAKNALLVLSLRESWSVHVSSGCAWITMERDGSDHWLSAGDALLLAPNPHIVIESDSPRTDLYFVRSTAAAPGARPGLRRFALPARIASLVPVFRRSDAAITISVSMPSKEARPCMTAPTGKHARLRL